ncbi:hypothetical protein HDU90_005058 [Geranomyces variabilis]|nr:hypothetical protein HDU90_005058 [Geranomyces variabilis]
MSSPVLYADPDILIAPEPEVPADQPHQLPRQPMGGSRVRISHQMRLLQTETMYQIKIQVPMLVEDSLVIEVEDEQKVTITAELQDMEADGLLFSNEAERLSVLVPLPSKVLEGEAEYGFNHGILTIELTKKPVEVLRQLIRYAARRASGSQQQEEQHQQAPTVPPSWNEATTALTTKWAATVTRAHIAPTRYRAEAIVDESAIIAGKLDEYPGLAMNLTTWIAFAADIRAAVANADICILPALEQNFENSGLSTTSLEDS